MAMLWECLFVSILAIACVSEIQGAKCHCDCDAFGGQSICKSVDDLWKTATTNTDKLREWEKYRPFVERFSERWRREIATIVEEKMEEYIARNLPPKPEPLIRKREDEMQIDWTVVPVSKPSESDRDAVSNLLAKVEKVENKTLEVEEELKSERRVRRHLEEEMKETQSSLIYLGDQLHNVTVPVNTMMNRVEKAIHSSLEDMNKTIYEEHLKKLYYKVDDYKNETKELGERLDHVEIELQSGDNSSIVSKLADGIKTLEENLHHLNSSVGETLVPGVMAINNSIGDVLIPRLETLETETVRRNETEELEVKMTNLLNGTELFRVTLIDLWSDIQDIQTFKKKFENFSEEWGSSLTNLQHQIEYLKNESINSRLLEQRDDDGIGSIFQQINTVPDEDGDASDELFLVNRSQTPEDGSAEYEESQFWSPNGTTSADGIRNLKDDAENNREFSSWNTAEYEELPTSANEVTSIVDDRRRIDGELNITALHCPKPEVEDDHLLIDVLIDSYGRNNLKFGCRPVGLFTVSHLPVPPRCEEGSWKEPFPSCTMLSNISTIEALAKELRDENPCLSSSDEFPDPTNCSQFFKCSHGKVSSVLPCPSGLHFNAQLKVCDYPRRAQCILDKSILDKKLQSLIPPILINPNNIDQPSSHLGTGSAGQLIVHPRSSFTLSCLFPENMWGYPKWNVIYTYSATNSRTLVPVEGENRASLTVIAAIEKDSGIYKCTTPFGIEHAVEVVVKTVVCPAFMMDEDYEDVFYRPTPEGELRIMGTRAEFQCEEGHRIFSQCLSNGTWSSYLPSEKECTLKKRSQDRGWSCKPLDASKDPYLILERNDFEKIITFKCSGGKRLIGNSFTRCRDDGLWSHISLPRCK